MDPAEADLNGPESPEPAPRPDDPEPPARRNVAFLAFGAAAVAILAGVLVFALIKHLNSTGSVRAILPPPAAAGGLNRDYADEHSTQFSSVVSTIDQKFRAGMPSARFGAAIYTNAPAGSSARGASIALMYIGINAPADDSGAPQTSPAANVKALLSGVGRQLTDARQAQEGGGAGDTRYACETGNTATAQVVVCAWSTDHSLGVLIPQVPASPAALTALMKKMEPDLVRS